MIAYLEGKIILKKEKFIILNVNHIGYKVFLSEKRISEIVDIDNEFKVFCFLNVRENSLDLYGFLDFKELEFFEILNNISGVGPKAALQISAIGSLESIKDRILAHDETIFEKISGIGRKRAMKIVLELSGKIKEFQKAKTSSANTSETEDALINLGFSREIAKNTIAKVSKDVKGSNKIIEQALKILGKQ
ncbi:MAG: Holliday junction branch migration protein RuvA [Patescibacteria group bacterium]|nr:Holliday junction branch migration protein RuvA [Patescibacteria group bacterium]